MSFTTTERPCRTLDTMDSTATRRLFPSPLWPRTAHPPMTSKSLTVPPSSPATTSPPSGACPFLHPWVRRRTSVGAETILASPCTEAPAALWPPT